MPAPFHKRGTMFPAVVTGLATAFLTLPACRDAAPPATPPPPPAAGTSAAAAIPRPAPQEFVGSQICAECHADQFDSYLHTAHSRSLSLVDPALEPPDGSFLHQRSGHSFKVYRQDGEMRHREAMLTTDGDTIAESNHAVKYLVGSGNHSRTYLSEIDGFLVESPITWYESRREWGVSPGYDVLHPPGFQRAADVGCLACHVGSAEAIDGSLHRIRFHELAIGCERCHGAGQDHVAASRANALQDKLVATITNPGALPRNLVEDICAQCHLRGEATVFLPGAGPLDFRPGTPLASVRVDYGVDSAHHQMEVVGHVEQMRLSRCHSQSGEMTCTTCHEMHAEGTAVSAEQFYRSKCLDCHAVGECGLPESDERRAAERDNCLNCHMPQSETDIPHIAFTHHRIGIHSASAGDSTPSEILPPLVPHQDLSGWEPDLVRRIEGLAYIEFASRQPSQRLFTQCQEQAIRRLGLSAQQQPADGELAAALAQLTLYSDPRHAALLAEDALKRDSLRAQSRVNALVVRGLTALQFGRTDTAAAAFGELQTIRRFAEDSVLLAGSVRERDPHRALAELRKAADIQPFRAELAAEIAALLDHFGQRVEAEHWRGLAAQLEEHSGQPSR